MNLKKIICAIAMLISAHGAFAQGDVYERSQTYEWPTDSLVVKKLKQWQDLKFGVLIHWGLYAVPGIVESWSICDENWITRDTTKPTINTKHGIGAYPTRSIPQSLTPSNGPQHSIKQG